MEPSPDIAEEMQVKVEDGLASGTAVVDDSAIAVQELAILS